MRLRLEQRCVGQNTPRGHEPGALLVLACRRLLQEQDPPRVANRQHKRRGTTEQDGALDEGLLPINHAAQLRADKDVGAEAEEADRGGEKIRGEGDSGDGAEEKVARRKGERRQPQQQQRQKAAAG